MPLILPHDIGLNDEIKSTVLQANFQAIKEKFSSGLVDADCSTLMALLGTKIAAGSMPGDRIIPGTVTQALMALLSVGTPQLIDLAVTKAKVATAVGSRLTKAQLELKVHSGTAGFSIGGGNTGFMFMPHIAQQVVLGTNSWVIKVVQVYAVTPIAAVSGIFRSEVTLAPVAAIPVASTTPVGVVLKNPVFAAGGGQVDAEMHYFENS